MEELTDFEKLIQNINTFAMLISEYYKALVSNGFSEEEAMFLTTEYQKEILNIGRQ